MKILIPLLCVAVLSGCAYPPPAPYAQRYPAAGDPSQWHTVSVTPVAPGTGARLGAEPGKYVQSTSQPIVESRPVYVQQPVYYAPAPVYYAPAPMYYAPAPAYYYPPISLSLGFGHSWGGRHGRNWGGIGIGTHWP
ncbi:hypothetical protein Q4S45_07720 [Massilia sp. R2A-15]|uniref:hypothetical protein n=1 Tax=Massilia sp. R2A-15 TaxID=3064278 RepID=UPI00273633AB|nr:hypothetical protein [Massilia sp. R2A-15]WLI90995.1 hypothetical protein Q4S45_07720 [Massilia sp. R2A-15]